MRSASAALAASFFAAMATPGAAQPEWPPAIYSETGPATVIVPRITYFPHVRYVRRTVLVPRTRFVPRAVYVPRTVYSPRTTYLSYPAYGGYGPVYGAGYPGGYRYGATYVPPGAAYGCLLGMVGCDSSYVGPLGDD